MGVKPAIVIIGFVGGAGVCYVFLNLFSTVNADNDWYMWVVLGVSVLLGIICAVLLYVFQKVGFFAAGALAGYIGGIELYGLIFVHFDIGGVGDNGSKIWFFLIIIALAIVGGILAVWLQDWMLIFATA